MPVVDPKKGLALAWCSDIFRVATMSELIRLHRVERLEDSTLVAEVEDCLRTIERLVAEPDLLASIPEPQRKSLLIAAGKLSRPVRHERERITKAIRRHRRKIEQQADLDLRRTTQIREGRSVEFEPLAREPNLHLLASGVSEWADEPRPRRLNQPQSCYVCKRDYLELHDFYDSMCPECAALNFRKRTQSADLTGRVALVTGSRIKIGFHTTLMLLRAGARVIGTTRFPHDAAARFAREADYEQWCDRLTLYGLDLRFCPSVEAFTGHLAGTLPRLDFLINNAAQTVHRPNGFFSHLREHEQTPLCQLPAAEQQLLVSNEVLVARLMQRNEPLRPELMGAAEQAALLAVDALPEPEYPSFDEHIHFPVGRFDSDGQQLDLRPNNSWRMKAADVSTPELIEVHLVNAIAPFLLVSRLKPVMSRTDARDKHIVNVSAMEGVFARRTKTDRHPHTNMAKASLNMLTRTSAKDFARDGIHMNSVDTGWVTDEDPHPHAVRKIREYDFSPPLDAIDGAARVCDPIFSGFLTGEHAFGQFFKDYQPSEW